MDDLMKQGKLSALKKIREIASQCMQDDMKSGGLKKVSVLSDSPEGLEKGLEKAKEIVDSGSTESMEGSEPEEYEDMMDDGSQEESVDSLEEQIKALMEKKLKLMKK